MISKENMELACILQIINELLGKLFEKLVLISPSSLKDDWLKCSSYRLLFDNLSWVMHESLLYDQNVFYTDSEIDLFFYIQLIFCPSWCLWQSEAYSSKHSQKIMFARMGGKWDCGNLNIWLLKKAAQWILKPNLKKYATFFGGVVCHVSVGQAEVQVVNTALCLPHFLNKQAHKNKTLLQNGQWCSLNPQCTHPWKSIWTQLTPKEKQKP